MSDGSFLAVIYTIDHIRIHLIPCFHKDAALMDDKMYEVINTKSSLFGEGGNLNE